MSAKRDISGLNVEDVEKEILYWQHEATTWKEAAHYFAYGCRNKNKSDGHSCESEQCKKFEDVLLSCKKRLGVI